jgi:DNA-binding NarL/FixJ family response regulator
MLRMTAVFPSSTAWVFSPHPLFTEEMGRFLGETSATLVRLPSSLDAGPGVLPSGQCSVAILDGCLPLPSTKELIAEILAASPRARLLAITEEMTPAVACPLLQLGVKGILTYDDARRQLLPAITAVARGGVWVPRHILSAFLDGLATSGPRRPLPNGARLSRREKEVLETVLESLSNKEIASRLNISERTVKFHVSNLLTKFSVQRRADLILMSFQASQARGPSLVPQG